MKKAALDLAVAALLGAWLALIHPPFGWPLIGIWALPAAYWWAGVRARRFLVGFGFGLGYFLLTLSWITEPFRVEAESYGFLAYPAWIALAAFMASYWTPIFALRRYGAFVTAALFLVMEFLRGWLFTGFPWALIGYGFADTFWAQSAAWFGVYGLSFLLAFGVLALLCGQSLWARGLGALVLALGILPQTLATAPRDDSFADYRVTLVQGNVSTADARDLSRMTEYLDRQIALSKGDADLVIWPESALYFSNLDQEPELRAYIARESGAKRFLIGAPYFHEGQYRNSAYLFDDQGALFLRYDKIHLVPFGEFIPLGEWLKNLGIAVETVTRFSMKSGTLAPWPDGLSPAINILICYEGIFPRYAQRDGAFIAILTNDDWFGQAGGPRQHLEIARFRAIEAGKPVARVARTGISAFIDARGKVTQSIGLGEEGAITQVIGPRYQATIYSYVGNWPLYALMALALLSIIWQRRSRNQGLAARSQ